MGLDLNAVGAKVIDGAGGGTSFGDPLRQTIQINQANVGSIPVTEANLEATIGTTADSGWVGTGVASLVAALKAIALRLGVGGSVQDGSGSISTGGLAQNLFGGFTPTNGYFVQNTSSGALWINDIGSAGGGDSPNGSAIMLNPGVMFQTPDGYKPPGAVSIYGATNGQTFIARKY